MQGMRKLPAPVSALILVLAVLPFGGCIATPELIDPLAGVSSDQTAGFKAMDAVLVYSENTRAMSGYLRQTLGKWDTGPVILQQTDDFTRKIFRTVVKGGTIDEAILLKKDVIVVLDASAQVSTMMTKNLAIFADVSFIFLSPEGKELDRVRSRHETNPFFKRIDTPVIEMWTADLKDLGPAIFASEKLKSYARSRPARAVAGVDSAELLRLMKEAARDTTAPGPAAAPRPGSDVDRPRYHAGPRPHDYAVVVGIEKYSGDLPEAQFAERDALAVKDHLLAMGFQPRNIAYLSGSGATAGAMKKNLESWLPNNVQDDSTVVFYYSGHGSPDAATGQAYLVPWDGDPQYLKDTAYPLKRVYENLGALKAKRVLVVLDSCFSGQKGRSVLAQGTRPLVTKIELGVPAEGKIVSLTASNGDQISGTLPEQGHGAFTYYFLKGLNGDAAGADGSVTIEGLYDFLAPKVSDAARSQNRDQTPQLLPRQNSAGWTLR